MEMNILCLFGWAGGEVEIGVEGVTVVVGVEVDGKRMSGEELL